MGLMRLHVPALVAMLLLLGAASSFGQVSQTLQYQGRLTDAGGSPLTAASANLQFDLYDAATSGNLVFTQAFASQPLSSGQFTVVLTSADYRLTNALAQGKTLWVQTSVNGTALAPRQQITSVLTAFKAQRADTASYALTGSTVLNGSIGTAQLTAGAVTTPILADGAVTSAKVAAGAVTSSAIAAGAVTAPAIGTGAVTAPAIGTGAVTAAALSPGAVTAPALGAGAAVANIANGTITGAQITPKTITAGNIADGTITGTQVQAHSITGIQIQSVVDIPLASVAGVVTLTDGGTSFHVSGAEAVTQIAGWSAGIAIIRWTQARTLTHDGTSLVLANAVSRNVTAGDVSIFQFVGSNQVREVGFYGAQILLPTLPTRQVLTTGTAATYTTPVGARQLRIRMIGGGGGGSGDGAAAGGVAGLVGGPSIFNSIAAAPGFGGTAYATGTGGAGGAGGVGSASIRIPGGAGVGGAGSNTCPGGAGVFGGVGLTKTWNVTAIGGAGAANTGAGGSGGTSNNGFPGTGGGAGEYVEVVINSPSASYTYTVGTGGAGGAGGTTGGNGGAGGSGIIIVDEIY